MRTGNKMLSKQKGTKKQAIYFLQKQQEGSHSDKSNAFMKAAVWRATSAILPGPQTGKAI